MRQDEHDQANFLMLTLWEWTGAIKKFAGNDINEAQYFAELEPNVTHYDVLINLVNTNTP